jgi:hypothetical protein
VKVRAGNILWLFAATGLVVALLVYIWADRKELVFPWVGVFAGFYNELPDHKRWTARLTTPRVDFLYRELPGHPTPLVLCGRSGIPGDRSSQNGGSPPLCIQTLTPFR